MKDQNTIQTNSFIAEEIVSENEKEGINNFV